jgi:hypothetical protein
MRIMSIVKIAALALGVAMPLGVSAASAKQLCINGALTQVVPCFSGFCTQKCGG